ncbi:TPA: dihydrolipoyl dehydrogenase [Clostridium botulinum]|nr:dihydrolipoyl dehydrogenase [Clostridium botulinum]HDK7223625.1 dihydrolipoyl dehydrogenase [Clostridium botulinum]HDK7271043.1 dihydrolipoyl dehydrogenase [Clostridium botulinum]HDK7304399.1 dihydrolipoyl dehydrogenase [Clostridium botulinum]
MSKGNTLDIIYKILSRLDKAMDEENSDLSDISFEALEISEIKWVRILQMMVERGLIDGVEFIDFCGQSYPSVKFMDIRITLEGIEYLMDNSTQAKLFRAAKELKDFIPGL